MRIPLLSRSHPPKTEVQPTKSAVFPRKLAALSKTLAGALLLAFLSVSAAAVTLYPTGDTYSTLTLAGRPPNVTVTKTSLASLTGAGAYLDVSETHTAFVQFQAGQALTGISVGKASLTIYFDSVARPGALDVNVVTSAWEEHFTGPNVTEPAYNGTALASIPAAAVIAKQFVTIDVTSAVQAWVAAPASDFGFAILSPDGIVSAVIGAKEGSSTGYPCVLEVEPALAAMAVGSANLADGAVGSSQLASGAVGSSALASGAVTSSALASGAVTSSALAGGAVTSSALAGGAVTSSALASGAVTSSALASGAVTSSALASGAVTSAAIASGAVPVKGSIFLTPYMMYNSSGASNTITLSTGATTYLNFPKGSVSDLSFSAILPSNFNSSTATMTVYYSSTTIDGNFDCSLFSRGADVGGTVGLGVGGGGLVLTPAASTTTLAAGSTTGLWDSNTRVLSLDLKRRGTSSNDTSTGTLQVYGVSIDWTTTSP